jgi:2-C-methyl-D-erythritol 4-phosphate cytidylyltransferase
LKGLLIEGLFLYSNMRYSFIITAGGIGKRMGSTQPKQFLCIGGQPILMQTIARLAAYDATAQLIVTLPKAHIDEWKDLCTHHSFSIQHEVIAGGVERYHSIKNALAICTGSVIGVHDGVRPFVSNALLDRLMQAVEQYKAVIPVISVNESLRKVANDQSNSAVERSDFRVVQTPQLFEASVLRTAYEIPFSPLFTDDASLVEQMGHPIHLVEGTQENIKITRSVDLVIADYYLQHK